MPEQSELKKIPALLPARMLNEYAYCPRLFYLEWVQGEFTHSEDTLEGKRAHKRVEQESGEIPDAKDSSEIKQLHAKSVILSSEKYGLIAKLDLIEGTTNEMIPVDYKKGQAPEISGGAWEPERVQLCAQALLLRENGYTCKEGVIYYAGSKKRVSIPITDELVSRTLKLLDDAKQLAAKSQIPPPLADDNKCPRCSLVGICLPDEVRVLSPDIQLNVIDTDDIRRLYPARDDAIAVYVQEQGAVVAKNGEELEVRSGQNVISKVRLMEISMVALFGNVQVTAQALHELCKREIPICYFSFGGWFYGITYSHIHKNIELRRRQYYIANEKNQSLSLAKRFVVGKIKNCRTMLRRNCPNVPEAALEELSKLADLAFESKDMDALLGVEGAASSVYFAHFGEMLKSADEFKFDFHFRNRRPPKDPVNALLSYAYAMLTGIMTVTLMAVGFDPYLGFYHQPRYGRPSLALDLIEEFRPLIADSVVLSVINNDELKSDDFICRAGSTAIKPESKKVVIRAFERRLDSLVTHPVFGYSISYRRVLEVQARLLGRYLTGEIKEYPVFLTR